MASPLPNIRVVAPRTDEDFERYFDLRWRILRAPWQQPRGSERDERENESIHLMLRGADDGEVLAAGRVHLNSPTEAQVRFMAVDSRAQGQGLGSLLLRNLEERARAAGAQRVVLNARASSERFYLRNGYESIGPAATLFGEIAHVKMQKHL
jgi:GNAT superfamily N-acetyltransferase